MALYHMAKGSVDYEVVGNPTIVDGVTSGFSGNDYLSLGYNVFPDFDSKFEMSVKFTTGQTITTSNLFGASNYYYNGFRIGDAGKILFSLNVGSIVTATLNYVLSANTTYKAVAVRSGNTITATLYDSANNALASYSFTLTDEQIVVQAAFTNIGQGVVGVFNGSIDLNQTYIKVNGQPWFGLCPVEVKRHQIMGPVGYTKVGNPTIVEGVASGFSGSDYLRIYNFQDSGTSCELNFTFTTPSNASNACLFYSNNFRAFFAYNGTRLNVVFNSGGSQETGYIDYTFDYGTKYTVNILRNVTTALVKIYKGTTLEKEVETTNISAFNNGNSTTMAMGYEKMIFSAPFKGSIDLNETYIKVNGKLWFYQPQETKYIVKDGKLVWADPHIYIDDNGTKTYATQNIAPVPSGYTFGNTTTPSIGYVDMRTQQFTAAPQGATIGRDE